jgi:tagatose-1,6-bisphosphate aldolase
MNLDKFTKNGKFLMLALDHRGSFKKLMNPENPDSITDEEVISLKNEIIEALKDEFSALLIDDKFGLEACHEACQVKPFLLPLEKSSHTGVVELEHSAFDLKNLCASGAKILFDFKPGDENSRKQLEIATEVAADCMAAEFPLFLEIVTHDEKLVIESLEQFIAEGVIPDVWKLEYPGSVGKSQEITDIAGDTPWILLTGGTDFETFRSNLKDAVKGGAKGFLAGRAIWQEVCTMEGGEKEKFLNETLPLRFKEVSEIVS